MSRDQRKPRGVGDIEHTDDAFTTSVSIRSTRTASSGANVRPARPRSRCARTSMRRCRTKSSRPVSTAGTARSTAPSLAQRSANGCWRPRRALPCSTPTRRSTTCSVVRSAADPVRVARARSSASRRATSPARPRPSRRCPTSSRAVGASFDVRAGSAVAVGPRDSLPAEGVKRGGHGGPAASSPAQQS